MLRRRTRRRRGASAVEFALCVPVLLLVLFAIVEYSRVLQIQNAVRQAAFEGARAGVALDAVTSDVTTAANNIINALGIKGATVTVTPNPISYTTQTVTVAVSAVPASNGWFVRFFTSGMSITSTISLDREVQAVSVTGS
jgi:Flp pilus assembly protein TadG